MSKKLLKSRVEYDSMGEVHIPEGHYYGAQTQRSIENFPIGWEQMPLEIIHALAIIKKAAAFANNKLGLLVAEKNNTIVKVCNEIISGELDDQFPLKVWQSGSGTQTHMNINEVISNRAIEILGGEIGSKKPVHPNDDVNQSQSTNDVFSSAMNLAAYLKIKNQLLPNLILFKNALAQKQKEFWEMITMGRTHMGDAVPLSLGQRFSGYVRQIEQGIEAIENSLSHLAELTLGGTAIGTGLNAPKDFAKIAVKKIAEITQLPFVCAKNRFCSQAAHDALVETSGALTVVASALIKIASDIRLMSSGPRCGFAEITLPSNEPGSSIMPGKENPTQCEAMIMAAIRVQGNHTSIVFAGSLGNFEAHSFRPLMIYSLLQSIQLLADVTKNVTQKCIAGIKANTDKLNEEVNRSLMLATVLNTHLGYETATKIVKKAVAENLTLKESAIQLAVLSEKEFDQLIDVKNMANLE